MVSVKRISPRSRRRKRRTARAAVLGALIRDHGLQDGIMAELGVFRGDTFFYLLDRFPNLSLVGVDTWEWGARDAKGTGQDDGARSYRESPLPDFEADIRADLPAYGARAAVLKSRTVDAARSYPDRHFDIVFIDADHTYEGVCADITAWRGKVRPGGILCGHDIDMPSVRAAVTESLAGWFCPGEVIWAYRVPEYGVAAP